MLGWLRTTVSSLTQGWKEGLPERGGGRGFFWMCLQWEWAADREQGLGPANMKITMFHTNRTKKLHKYPKQKN